jgi:hypothetical protein
MLYRIFTALYEDKLYRVVVDEDTGVTSILSKTPNVSNYDSDILVEHIENNNYALLYVP